MQEVDTRDTERFRIDRRSGQLLRGNVPVSLRPKTWAVLLHLVSRPGHLVTKQELLEAVWPDAVVSEGTLGKSIGELRLALDDDPESPRFIQTLARRGFRWIGPTDIVEGAEERPAPEAASARVVHATAPDVQDRSVGSDGDGDDEARPFDEPLVGRELQMESLTRAWRACRGGSRQTVFVTGEAGAGKSSLVEAFLSSIEGGAGHGPDAPLVALGQCIEARSQQEPYRPLLEAVERLTRSGHVAPEVVEALRSHAPTWLRRIPSIAGEDVEADVEATPARMLREAAAALEAVSRLRPLVLVLEDAHWTDLATLDALNLLARRPDRARLFVLVTMRLADAIAARHPLVQARSELTARGLAHEVAVDPFGADAVRAYLGRRLPGLETEQELAAWIHHQTGGNPLFVRVLVDDLVQRGLLDAARGLARPLHEWRDIVPDSLRDLVERQLDHLGPVERTSIEAACVLSGDFDPGTLARIAGADAEEVEAACTDLAKRGRILKRAERTGTGARSGRFVFVHSMVQRIVHDSLPGARRRRLHLAAAGAIAASAPQRGDAVAVQLALHHAMADDPAAAIAHLQRAAASVQRIPAPREVIVIRERILELVEANPELENHRYELLVALMDLAQARQLAYAVVDAEGAALCERVLSLAVPGENPREAFLAMMGMFSFRFNAGRYEEAREYGRRLLAAAEMFPHPVLVKSAHFAIAGPAYRLADFADASTHFCACLEHAADSQDTFGWDFHSMSRSHLALIAIHEGRPEEARGLVREALAGGADSLVAAVTPVLAFTLAVLGDDAEAMDLVRRSLARADRIGAAAWIERARFLEGLLLLRGGSVEQGLRLAKESLARQARQGVFIDRSAYCAMLAAEMLRRSIDGAAEVIDEGLALVERCSERHFEPELRRLRAALA